MIWSFITDTTCLHKGTVLKWNGSILYLKNSIGLLKLRWWNMWMFEDALSCITFSEIASTTKTAGLGFCLLYFLHFHTYETSFLTPWSRVLFEKLTFVNKLQAPPPSYGTGRWNIIFIKLFHSTLHWVTLIKSISSHPISLQTILILFSYKCLCLPSLLGYNSVHCVALY
jgi:hypothetical protein